MNNNKDNFKKFDAKANECIFLGYSIHSKTYRVFNKKTIVVEESVHVTFNEHNFITRKITSDDVDEVEQNVENLDIQPSSMNDLQKEDKAQETSLSKQKANDDLPREYKCLHNHPTDQILGDPSQGVRMCSSLRNICNHLAFLSQIEPKYFKNVKNDEFWINTMQEELNQFKRNEVWHIPKLKDHSIIETKWVFRYKMDEFGVVVRNKTRLVA